MRNCRRPLMIACIALLAAVVACAQEGNLLPNPGFEAWTDVTPEAWEAEIGEATPADDAHSGERSLRLATVSHGDYFSAMFYASGKIEIKRDTLYLASVWAKGTGEIRICLQQYGEPTYMGGRSSLHTALSDEWTLYQFY